MVKSYTRFEPVKSFGVVSSDSNLLWLPPTAASSSAGRALVGGLEDVLSWDVKTSTLLSRWKQDLNSIQETKELPVVTRLAYEPNTKLVAAGHSDGSINIWDSHSGTIAINFNGHKSAVTSLHFDKSGTRLVSGSEDTNIIVWDLVGEVGLYRLRSHRAQVTEAVFVFGDKKESTQKESDEDEEDDASEPWLISVAKDGLVKLWDLETQHCIETHVAHKGECWSFTVLGDTLITTGSNKEVNFWRLDFSRPDGEKITHRGMLEKQSSERGVSIKPIAGQFIGISNSDRSIEIWRVRSAEEVKKSVVRKLKRRKEKGLEDEVAAPTEEDVGENFVPFAVIRTPAKVRHFDWMSPEASLLSRKKIELVVSLNNNTIESYTIPVPSSFKKNAPADYSRQFAVDLPAHKTDVRALSISSDDKLVASASNGALKVWNIASSNCLRTFECGYALCASFLPGDALIVVGTKTGDIELFDVASSSLLDRIEGAHGGGAVWSLHVSADGKTMVTGGADKAVKFWEFKVVQEEVPGAGRTTSRMKLKHRKTLELSDEVICVRFSPDGKLLAVSLMDMTIKVFFADTLKFFLSLYGHKLPALSIDISYDSKLLVSAGADKNVKIWGLDFGDCHRSIFAHDEAIKSAMFEPGSHNFFTVAEDKSVKYWDGDKFDLIQKLNGHHDKVLALAVSHHSSLIITASHDKSIRVWQQFDEPLFIQEEREKELEELYESTLTASLEDDVQVTHDDEEGGDNVERAGKQTVETLKAGEKLMEALDIGIKDLEELKEYEELLKTNPKAVRPPRNVILAAMKVSAEQYVFSVLQKIKPAQCEDALLVLPFDKVQSLLRFIEIWTEKRWNTPLVCRVLFFILRIHHKQIVAHKIMRPMIEQVRENLRSGIVASRNQIGYNIAGLDVMKRTWQLQHQKEFVDDMQLKEEQERLSKKRAFTTV
ncbi:U3 small nucleolar RNA-associated protein 12 [Trichomonascus vanleenenianus]|uniref:snoRNA-binding rRNA-processing protein DIP2 n=1 Tax=Trichomonascus vanleenenianus TaxID=2268995 RepID=UPI003EC9F84C